MSRFFAKVEEESEEENQALDEIKEEKDLEPEQSKADTVKEDQKAPTESKNPKKKKKGKTGKGEESNALEGQEQAPKESEPKEKKEKKKTGQALQIQKKIAEKRKIEEETRRRFCEVFYNVACDYHKSFFIDLKTIANDFRRKVEQKKKKETLQAQGLLLTKKEKLQKEKNERAKQMFEQLNLFQPNPNHSLVNNPIQAAQSPEERPFYPAPAHQKLKRKKKLAQAQQEAGENCGEGSHKNSIAESDLSKPQNSSLNSSTPGIQGQGQTGLNFENVENWMDLVSDEPSNIPAPTKIEKTTSLKQPIKPEAPPAAVEKPPVKKSDKPAPSQKPAPKAEETKPTNPLDFFNFKSKNRCPIICIMGHVDTGKTKLLDHIRNTNVQAGEAGGITQQIGASFFPQYKLIEEASKVDKKVLPVKIEIPGLLIIDTPGHESFANLRSRGSSLCDFAIVVVDIMHGLENQTRESLRMLIERKTPFVIALNKIDRLYQWNAAKDQSSYSSLQKQTQFVRNLFNEQLLPVTTELAKMEINSALYWNNEDPLEYTSIVPTSAITGEGVPDLLAYIAHFTQTFLPDKILRRENEFKATVLEVKKTEGLGATVDIIIVNGALSLDDKIVLSGFNGPITTVVKALLTPHPMKEMRVKNEFLHHQTVIGSMGVKLSCQGMESALAGSALYKYSTEEELKSYVHELKDDIKKVKKIIKLSNEGVGVAASSLGSLEALLVFLKQSKIPVASICIGDVSKSDLIKVLTPFLAEEDEKAKKKREFLTMLCFDVKILPEAAKYADDNGIKIISAKIIYHLFDEFTKHVDYIKEIRKKEEGKKAVFPCVLKPVAVFNKKDPIIMGVDVVAGVLRIGTPLCVPEREKLRIGVVESIEANHKSLKEARKKHGSVAIRIKGDSSVLVGRHFEPTDELISVLTRDSIDALKEHFRDDMTKDDWDLVRNLKGLFDIQ